MKLIEVASIVGGVVYGNEDLGICEIRPPEEAQEGDLTFLFQGGTTEAGVIIASRKIEGRSGVVVKDVKKAMYLLLKKIAAVKKEYCVSAQAIVEGSACLATPCGVEPFAVIRHGVKIGAGTLIGAHCYIDKGVVIGEHCELFPNTVVYGNTTICNFVVVHANTVIGKEGFGYVKETRYEKIPHVGGVVIRDFVEVGSNVTIDRGTVGATVIGEGTKIDNQVHIAHNVKIGRDCIIMGQSGIAGSSKIGNNVVLCGQVGISDHVEIEDGVVVYAKSGVFKSLKKGRKYSGTPAREHQAVLRAIARLYAGRQISK